MIVFRTFSCIQLKQCRYLWFRKPIKLIDYLTKTSVDDYSIINRLDPNL